MPSLILPEFARLHTTLMKWIEANENDMILGIEKLEFLNNGVQVWFIANTGVYDPYTEEKSCFVPFHKIGWNHLIVRE